MKCMKTSGGGGCFGCDENVPGERRVDYVWSTICKISFISIFRTESVRTEELNPTARTIYSLDDESTLSDTNS